ncbi:MAG: hypothetical protein EA397_06090 [Deltaproteobacteria bacterium]|nr:MAG: hypothetical protein EA397_06090 [Deltaproteobacteria bacterium]
MSSVLPVAVVGCGSMGRHHARAIARHSSCQLVGVVDRHLERARELGRELGVPGTRRIPASAVLVVVATPAHAHVKVAHAALEQGRWCLIEKPLAPLVAQAQALDHPRAIPAYVERYNPRLPVPLPPFKTLRIERTSPPSGRGQGIDVLSDLLVHDLDLLHHRGIHWSGMRGIRAVRGAGGMIDEIELTLSLDAGRAIAIRASRMAEKAARRWRFDQVEVDLSRWKEGGADPLARQLDQVLARIAGRPDQAPTIGQALLVLEQVEQIRAAI